MIKVNTSPGLDRNLIHKYDEVVPYYTSYPVLGKWTGEFNVQTYQDALRELCLENRDEPLSLYLHFPFCAKMCYYCICNFIVTHDREKISKFMGYLLREIDMLADFFEAHAYRPKIKDIHLGGGTPSYMTNEELDMLLEKLKRLVDPKDLEVLTIEIDIRVTKRENIEHYLKKGITRISFGIQDFDPVVQRAINREQTPELFEQVCPPELRKKFKSFNFDLLYGLPFQTRESFKRTIDTVKKISPDRITLLKYAHVPHIRKHMRLIDEADLPDTEDRKAIFYEAVKSLEEAGYEHIGIDHFAQKTDDLAIARRNKAVGRSFIGFFPERASNLISLGPSSTMAFKKYYVQNVYTLNEYYQCLDNNEFPVHRGYVLTQDDQIRRDIINAILCNYEADLNKIGKKHGVDASKYFEEEISSLKELVGDGLITYSDGVIEVTDIGRIFIQYICKVFDAYLKGNIYQMSGP